MIGTPGGGEILLLLAIGVLLFGGKLPEIMRKLGHGVTEFRKGVQGINDPVRSGNRPAAPEEDDEQTVDEVPRFLSDDGQQKPDNDVPKFQSQM